jgi:hypothetical protein
VHFIDSIADVTSGGTPTDTAQLIHIFQPESGDYRIEIRDVGLTPIPYTLIEAAFATDGSPLWRHEFSSVVVTDSVDQYGITYTAPEPSTLILLGVGAITLLAYSRRRRAA